MPEEKAAKGLVALTRARGNAPVCACSWCPLCRRTAVPQVIASYMEIYNDRLYDLLQPYKRTGTRQAHAVAVCLLASARPRPKPSLGP